MRPRRVRTAAGPLEAVLRAVPSKSVTHRALVAASLASGTSVLVDPLDADDTRATAEGLSALGIPVHTEGSRWRVDGLGGRVPGGGALFLRDSGTSLRFLLAVATLGERPSLLDGSARLRERPLRELVEALVAIGGRIRLASHPAGLPAETGGGLRGGAVRLPAERSSQFASALLLVGPRLPMGIDLEIEPPVVSLPYVELSAKVIADFGAVVQRPGSLRWRVPNASYVGREYVVEGDHSSASYFLAAAAVAKGRVRVTGLDPESLQPDARLGRILPRLGCEVRFGSNWIEVEGRRPLRGFDVDLTDSPDLAPTLAVLSAFAEGPSSLRGVAHLRGKESDRLAMLAENLNRIGRQARAEPDRLEVAADSGTLRGGQIVTASDHRLAMAFAVAGLCIEGVVIDDADCVAKSNPRFWVDFERLEAR